jgi:hypothetical protein
MSDPSYAVQAAVYAALTGASPEIASDRVYDTPPSNPTFPYVTIGEGDTIDDGTGCFDGSEVTVTVDIWSRTASFGEVKLIAGAIRDVLAQPLTLANFNNPAGEFVLARWLRDPDGITKHGALQFRYLVAHEYAA